MARPYSEDIRERVVARVEGRASRREAAEHFEVCPSSAIKWVQRVERTGSCAAKPSGGSVSPLDRHKLDRHKKELMALIAAGGPLSAFRRFNQHRRSWTFPDAIQPRRADAGMPV